MSIARGLESAEYLARIHDQLERIVVLLEKIDAAIPADLEMEP